MLRKCVLGFISLLLVGAAACASAPTPAPRTLGIGSPTGYPFGGQPTTVAATGATAYPALPGDTPPPSGYPAAPAVGANTALPAGPLTIVALGDSLTEGQGDDSGLGGYPGRLLPLIQNLRPDSQMVNVARSGWTSTDLLNGHDADPSQLTQALAAAPNVALVWVGSNDLWYLYEYGPEPMTAEAEAQDYKLFSTNLDTLLSRLRDAGVLTFVALLDDQAQRPVVARPPNPNELAFPATTGDDLARMAQQVTVYNTIIQHKAQQYGAVTVDFFHTTLFTDPATLSGDGNHPNPAGYDAITRLWWAALETRLK